MGVIWGLPNHLAFSQTIQVGVLCVATSNLRRQPVDGGGMVNVPGSNRPAWPRDSHEPAGTIGHRGYPLFGVALRAPETNYFRASESHFQTNRSLDHEK